jgi:ferredoxin
MESRVFPALVYDPSAGSDWATRLTVDDNPKPDDDWPVHSFTYEDAEMQARTEPLAFTLADFIAMDDRFFRHYSIVPPADWSDAMIPVPEALPTDVDDLPSQVPCITLVDDEGRLHRAILDERALLETRRCLTMWHSLQELGGIHNSHAERLLARERKAAQSAVAVPYETAVTSVAAPVPAESILSPEAPVLEPATETGHGDEPYIETARCTSCNECTQINSKMFAYDENKQAYIADPDAGTFRQLVEAAEGCQVSIIHPGKPRNPKEPGLDDLIRRAGEFN